LHALLHNRSWVSYFGQGKLEKREEERYTPYLLVTEKAIWLAGFLVNRNKIVLTWFEKFLFELIRYEAVCRVL